MALENPQTLDIRVTQIHIEITFICFSPKLFAGVMYYMEHR
jgi:hypothetical protein